MKRNVAVLAALLLVASSIQNVSGYVDTDNATGGSYGMGRLPNKYVLPISVGAGVLGGLICPGGGLKKFFAGILFGGLSYLFAYRHTPSRAVNAASNLFSKNDKEILENVLQDGITVEELLRRFNTSSYVWAARKLASLKNNIETAYSLYEKSRDTEKDTRKSVDYEAELNKLEGYYQKVCGAYEAVVKTQEYCLEFEKVRECEMREREIRAKEERAHAETMRAQAEWVKSFKSDRQDGVKVVNNIYH